MSNPNDSWNPDDFAPVPEELLANQEEQTALYAETEEVVETSSKFLNIEGAEFGQQIYTALQEGHLDPIKTLLMIKKMQHLHDYFLGSDKGRTNPEAKAYFRDKIINEIGKETYRAYGAQISIEAVGGATSMNYIECQDPYLTRLYELKTQLMEMINERQTFIKTTLPPDTNQIGLRSHKETIESLPVIRQESLQEELIANIVPPIKYGREGIVVRWIKKKK